MATGADMSEVFALARDIEGAGGRISREHRQAVSKGAVQVKKQLRADMDASTHFKGVTRALNYEMTGNEFFSEAAFRPGSLAHIAYWGGATGGGGTVRDPKYALESEAPRFFKALEDMAEKAVFG